MKRPKVIVSLTSFPAAIHLAPIAIQSILDGSVLPDKVVLYLTASQFPGGEVPREIEALKQNPIFEVRFREENIRSYTKLIPALHDFPDDIIITIDDDKCYGRRMVEQLLHWHDRHSDAIIAHRVRRMVTNNNGNLKPYLKWKQYKPRRYWRHVPKPGHRNLLFGVGGVLYPPHALDSGMLDPALFMSIAPTVDDVWFWAAAVQHGTKIHPVPFGYWRLDVLDKPQEIALSTENIFSGVDVNRNVVLDILGRYPLVKERLEKETGHIKM